MADVYVKVICVKSSLQNLQLSWSRLGKIQSPDGHRGNKLFKCITQHRPQNVTFQVMAQGIWMPLGAFLNTRTIKPILVSLLADCSLALTLVMMTPISQLGTCVCTRVSLTIFLMIATIIFSLMIV